MVNPKAVHDVIAKQRAEKPMGMVEDHLVFGTQRNQLIHVEESPVVDLVVGRPPVRQTVMLRFQDAVQRIRASEVTCSSRSTSGHPAALDRAAGQVSPESVKSSAILASVSGR